MDSTGFDEQYSAHDQDDADVRDPAQRFCEQEATGDRGEGDASGGPDS